jgi:hypothetical protein
MRAKLTAKIALVPGDGCPVIPPEAVVLDVQEALGYECHQVQVGWRHSRGSNKEFDGRDSLAAADTASLDDLPLQE